MYFVIQTISVKSLPSGTGKHVVCPGSVGLKPGCTSPSREVLFLIPDQVSGSGAL